jgi:putative endonuclease
LTRSGLDKRVGEHASGKFKGYTFWRRPVELVWSQEFQRLKGWRREKKEAIIRGDCEALIELSRTAKSNRC